MRRYLGALWLALALWGSGAAGWAQAQAPEPTRVRDVIYRKKEGVALTLDVFKPEKPSGIGVLWMVSGGWVSNHNSISAEHARIFTARGQTVFAVVHGAQPRYKVAEIVEDIHRAVRFVRAHAREYGVDPDRLGISGGSAGGHLSLMMGGFGRPGDPNASDPVDRESSRVQAVACFFPPTDFFNYGKEGVSAFEIPTLKVFWPALGFNETMSAEERKRIGEAISPILGISKETPPTLIIHGDADLLVPIQQSQRYIEKLKAAGVPCELVVRPGKAHGWPGIEKDGDLLAAWFEKYLAKK